MHDFNSGFLRTYRELGSDTNGDAIIYNVILKSLTLRFQPNFTSFYWSPFSFCFLSPSPSSSAFPSVSFLSSSAVSHSLGRGGISCSEVGWFLGGVRRPDSRLEAAGLPPDTRRWNPPQGRRPYARTKLAAGRHRERSPKRQPEWPNPGWQPSAFPTGQRTSWGSPGPGWLAVALVALETDLILLLALNMPQSHQAEPLSHP